MSAFLSPFMAVSILADIPPPPRSIEFHYSTDHSYWMWLLIYVAVSAVAIAGLRIVFRRRVKNSAPLPKESAAAKK